MTEVLAPMSPAQFEAAMAQVIAAHNDPRLTLAEGVALMVVCLYSNGYGRGIDQFERATQEVR